MKELDLKERRSWVANEQTFDYALRVIKDNCRDDHEYLESRKLKIQFVKKNQKVCHFA